MNSGKAVAMGIEFNRQKEHKHVGAKTLQQEKVGKENIPVHVVVVAAFPATRDDPRENVNPSNVAIQLGMQTVPGHLAIERRNSMLATRNCNGTSQKEG